MAQPASREEGHVLLDLNGFSSVTGHLSTKIHLQIEFIILYVSYDLLIYLNDKKRASLYGKQHQVRSPILKDMSKASPHF